MTCKYFDCGFCYAPEGVKNNAVQGGCFEPEYCPYLMENKQMTEQEHLECEIQELELEIEGHNKAIQNLKNVQERRKQKLKKMELKEQIDKLEDKNWKVEVMNATYPVLEFVDENTVKIDGVEYKKVEKQKPQTLFQHLNSFDMVCPEFVCNIVRGWLIDHTTIETEDAEKVTFTIHKEQLQTPK